MERASSEVSVFVQELFRLGLYKRSQGRVARQVTFAALALIIALGSWRMSQYLSDHGASATGKYAIPLVVLAVGGWTCFRIVQMPKFADFLISVEAEMNKVSWPSRGELIRASIVVMVVIFVMAAALFLFDLVWKGVFGWLLK